MRNSVLVILMFVLFSCGKDKEIKLYGTIWVNENNTEQLEFSESICKYILKSEVPGKEVSAIYSYEYDNNEIMLLVPASTGFYNYKGIVSKDKIILYPIFKDDDGNDLIIEESEFMRVFYRK